MSARADGSPTHWRRSTSGMITPRRLITPRTCGAARGMAAVFDLQHEAAGDLLIPDPETGEKINVSHMIPKSREDVARRHKGLHARRLREGAAANR